nr:hypothetical protein W07G9.1 - Caenorhabditis elegans [Caenorhabditis elegans]
MGGLYVSNFYGIFYSSNSESSTTLVDFCKYNAEIVEQTIFLEFVEFSNESIIFLKNLYSKMVNNSNFNIKKKFFHRKNSVTVYSNFLNFSKNLVKKFGV